MTWLQAVEELKCKEIKIINNCSLSKVFYWRWQAKEFFKAFQNLPASFVLNRNVCVCGNYTRICLLWKYLLEIAVSVQKMMDGDNFKLFRGDI